MAKTKTARRLIEMNRIIASAGNTVHKDIVARAFLNVIVQAELPEEQLVLTSYVISRFNHKRRQTAGTYPFEPTWTAERWKRSAEDAINRGFLLSDLAYQVIGCDKPSPAKAAAIILETLSKYEDDQRVYIFATALYSPICPFNYWAPDSGRVSNEEWRGGIDRLTAIKELDRFRAGEIRFWSTTDFGAFVRMLLNGLPEKDQDIVLGYALNAATEDGTRKTEDHRRSSATAMVREPDPDELMTSYGGSLGVDDGFPFDGFLEGEGGGHC